MCKKILLVEDDEAVATMVSEVLRDEGYEVVVLEGAEVVGMARFVAPQAVILDLRMASMSGERVAAHLHRTEITADVPIIVLSAAEDAATIAERIGAQAVVHKPFDVGRFVALVRRVAGAPDGGTQGRET